MPLKVGSGVDFLPDRDLPDLSGKIILITGGTGSLGKAAILTLITKSPSNIYLTTRNPPQCQKLIKDIQLEHPDIEVREILYPLNCDLEDLKTVQAAAHEVLGSPEPKLDIILGSAGVMLVSPSVTKDGYEIQFGINHMSHALLIKLLLPLLLKSPDGRIVLFTSQGFGLHPAGGILFDSLRSTQEKEIRLATRWQLYGQSKLANILYTAELARRYPGVTSVSVHPGVVNTGSFASLPWLDRAIMTTMNVGNWITPEEGSRNALWSATAPLWKGQKKSESKSEAEDERVRGKGFVVNGAYYDPVGVPGGHMRQSDDEDLAKRLWDWTEKELERFD